MLKFCKDKYDINYICTYIKKILKIKTLVRVSKLNRISLYLNIRWKECHNLLTRTSVLIY